MPKGTPKYFEALDNQRKAQSRSLDVTIREAGKPTIHFIQPPRDNPKYKFQTQDVSDQILANNLRDAHQADKLRKKKK